MPRRGRPGGPPRPLRAKPEARPEARALQAAGGMLGALAASSCCVAPLVLFSLGITGAWIGALAAMAPYQPYAIALTLVFVGVGFVMVYRKPKAAGAVCARPALGRITKPALWAATALVGAAAVFPYVAPALLGVD